VAGSAVSCLAGEAGESAEEHHPDAGQRGGRRPVRGHAVSQKRTVR